MIEHVLMTLMPFKQVMALGGCFVEIIIPRFLIMEKAVMNSRGFSKDAKMSTFLLRCFVLGGVAMDFVGRGVSSSALLLLSDSVWENLCKNSGFCIRD